MAQLRIVILGEDPLVRRALVTELGQVPGMAIAGEAGALEGLLPSSMAGTQIALYDGGPRPLPSLDELGPLKRAGLKVVLLLPGRSPAVAAALQAGVDGLLPRDAQGGTLAAGLRAVAEGLLVMDEGIAAPLLRGRSDVRASLPEPLTPREREVLQLISDGLSNKEIADRLGMSAHTAKFHLASILAKLGAQSRTEAVVRAARLGLLLL
jgi:two-component system nitrate/nitrite response regulator NarL